MYQRATPCVFLIYPPPAQSLTFCLSFSCALTVKFWFKQATGVSTSIGLWRGREVRQNRDFKQYDPRLGFPALLNKSYRANILNVRYACICIYINTYERKPCSLALVENMTRYSNVCFAKQHMSEVNAISLCSHTHVCKYLYMCVFVCLLTNNRHKWHKHNLFKQHEYTCVRICVHYTYVCVMYVCVLTNSKHKWQRYNFFDTARITLVKV
jgi:hypothetical protein